MTKLTAGWPSRDQYLLLAQRSLVKYVAALQLAANQPHKTSKKVERKLNEIKHLQVYANTLEYVRNILLAKQIMHVSYLLMKGDGMHVMSDVIDYTVNI